jgi:hypothetical protein
MADHTAESIKSLENCRIAWVEEVQTLSHRSLALLRPTIRRQRQKRGRDALGYSMRRRTKLATSGSDPSTIGQAMQPTRSA